MRAGRPGCGGCCCASGRTGRLRGVAEILASNCTSADTATRPMPTEMEILTAKSAGADTAAPDRHYGNGNLAAAPASWNADSGIAAGSGSRRDWTTIVCFSCGKPGHGVGSCLELDEAFPYMLPGWSAEKVGANYMVSSPRFAAERLRRYTATDLGRGVSRPDQ